MRGERIRTQCLNCSRASLVEERGYCPYCGAGPAEPSRERVDSYSGLPMKEPLTDFAWPAYMDMSRPISQVIPQQKPEADAVPLPRRVKTIDEVAQAIATLAVEHQRRPTQADVADRLGISVDTLARTLQDHGTMWRRLVARNMTSPR